MEDNKTTSAAENTANAAATTKDNNAGQNNSKTFTQEDMDKLAGKVRAEEKAKSDTAIKQAVELAMAEYDRQAKLTQEQKEAEARTKREKEIADREKAVTMRERKLDAQSEPLKRNMPIELAEFIVDLDENKMKENIEALSKAYNKAVENGINEKIKGKAPVDFSSTNAQGNAKKPVQKAF